jgi:hypothetical protein
VIFQVVADDGPALGPKARNLTLHLFKCVDALKEFKVKFDPLHYPDRVRSRLSKTFYIEDVIFHNSNGNKSEK